MADVAVYSRAEMVAKWKRDFQLRVPTADVGPNTQPDIDANLVAEQALIVHADAITIGRSTNVDDATGTDLDTKHGNPIGVPRLEAAGASGFVVVAASSGGTTIFAGDELTYPPTRARYRCTVTDLYADGDNCPVAGIDTGTATDREAGAILQWVSPRPGCEPTCAVYENSNGTGLTGGAEAENDDDYRVRIKARLANPPASGNDAAYIAAIEAYPGIGIQKGFTYPCITGPGVTAITFTLRPSAPGASRIPSPAQLSAVKAALRTAFPADDGIYAAQLIAEDVSIVLGVTWRKRAKGWADAVPWPVYVSPTVAVDGAVTPTATSFRLTTSVDTTTPQVGNTIAFYDAANQKFVNKRIGAVAVIVANRSWTITVDTANNASDTTYTPIAGDIASPWSESLNLLVAPVLAYFDGLGPGEQVATFLDPGTRQRRQPENPEAYPSAVSNRLATAIQAVSAVNDAELVEPVTLPHSPTVGTPGIASYLLQLSDFAVYEQ
jgi:uncharacterized phage protein gp47/JayE